MQRKAGFPNKHTAPHVATLILASALSALVMNQFLPSLPRMTTYFETEYRIMQLSVALYLLFNALAQTVVGPISDRFGRRPVMLGGLGFFMLATLGCLFAPSIEVFLVFRMLQASVVVGMVLSRASIRDVYDDTQSAAMIGYVTMGMSVAPMISPALGGALDQMFGWKANFWFFFVVAGLMMILVWSDMGETAKSSGKSLREQIRDYPELFTSPRFWGYTTANALSSGAFFAYLGGAPFVGSVLFNLPPAQLGIYFGAPAIGYFFGNFLSARLSVRWGINRMIFWGTIILGVGMSLSLALFLGGIATPLVFFGCMTFVGVGNGMTIPNATAGMLSVRPHLAGTASGLGGAIMLAGGAGLSAFAGSLLSPESGAIPLIVLMLSTSLLGLLTILLVIRRERQLGL